MNIFLQDYEFVVYRDNPVNVELSNGLKITPKLLKDEFGDAYIKNGNLTLQKLIIFTYQRSSIYCSL